MVGGPAGSFSMLFVNSDQCFDTCGKPVSSHFFIYPLQRAYIIALSTLFSEAIKIHGLDINVWGTGPNLYFCKNKQCNAYDLAAKFGQCKHFQNGVWAKEDCGCL